MVGARGVESPSAGRSVASPSAGRSAANPSAGRSAASPRDIDPSPTSLTNPREASADASLREADAGVRLGETN